MTATLTAQLSADIRKKREHTMVDLECVNYVLNLLTCSTHGIWLGHTESRDCCNCCLQLDTPSSLAESWHNGSSAGRGWDNWFQTCSHPPREWGRVWGFQLRYHEPLPYSSGSPQLQQGSTVNTRCTFKLGLGCDFPKKLYLLLLKVTLTL